MAYTKLHETITTSTESLVVIDNVFNDEFNTYDLLINQFGSSNDNKNLMFQFIKDNGSAGTTNYKYANYYQYSEGGYTQQQNNSNSRLYFSYATSAEQASSQYQVSGTRTSNNKFVFGKFSGTYKGTYTYHYNAMTSAMKVDSNKMRGFQLYCTNANIRAGLIVRVYGIS